MTTPPGPQGGGDPPAEANGALPARLGEERLTAPVIREGMFGAQGTPASSRMSIHSPLVRVVRTRSIRTISSPRWARRSALVTKRGSLAHSG